MQKVAENIEGSAKTESNYRRIQRIFKDQDIDFDMTARLLSLINGVIKVDFIKSNYKRGICIFI
jgi:hypothetical protein